MAESLEQEIVRAGDAERILNDPVVRDALNEMESAVVDRIAICPPENVNLQQKLCMMLGVVRSFRSILQTHLETGRLAMEQFEQQKKTKRFGIF